MKTRSTPVDPPNIAAGVKARRTARIGSPLYRSQSDSQPEEGSNSLPATSVNTIDKIDEHISKSRQVSQKASIKDIWTAYDRKLFFQGVRLYGRNFNELARFMRSRGHRTDTATNTTSNQLPVSSEVPSTNPQPNSPNVVAPVAAAAGLLPSNSTNQSGAQSAGVEGRTKDQVRLFYQQTWHKLRRYIKYPDGVPQHVREVYAIINWSIMRCRIKKALDNRLGEKLNELVHYGSTCVKHNGRRFLLRTPVCPALKQLNHISAPTQEFTLPDDVWVELVPATQMVAWRVLEAEQNPRLRLRVDINRQLSDVISLVEAKWVFPTDRIRSLLCPVDPTAAAAAADNTQTSEKLLLRFVREQRLDGAISLQEVSRTRSTDIALNAYLARRQSSQSPSKTVSPADANVGNTTPDVVAGEGTAAPASRTSTHEDQRPAVPPRTGGAATAAAASTVTSGVVHLDLHTVGKQLATGVTFEEARAIKLIVIFLALGCPARIRFEYDFVQSGHGKASSYIALSKEAMANGEGISNGLRRLLHLSASEYLNLKNWN
uniref:Protein cramped-like n=2 Tax=Mesocestoides corti TaxID=53468 RepID=A0A5K3FRU9_MESCO